jgi:hypothetical protein
MVVRSINRGDGLLIHATLLLMQKLALLSLFLLSTTVGFAQCSMCKAVAETADGGGFGAGLNYGIVYLMIFPYLIIGGIAYKIYKNKKAYK